MQLQQADSAQSRQSCLIGASLSEPHTSGTTLQDACVCLHTTVWSYRKLNWIRICTRGKALQNSTRWTASLSNSKPVDLLNVTEDSSPCNSTPMNLLSARERLRLERERRATARLQRRRQREQGRRRSEQTEAKLDRRRTQGRSPLSHSVDPSAWS